MLCAISQSEREEEAYQFAANEICRGIQAVSGLSAQPSEAGWVAVECHSSAMAKWLAEAIERENVQARPKEKWLLLPVAAHYQLEEEIKSVITVVAKTTDYWFYHLPEEVKYVFIIQEKLEKLKKGAMSWFGRE